MENISKQEKAIVTVVGLDTIGIIAAVCTYCADHTINILDIAQTTLQGYFNMMMIVDITNSAKPFHTLSDELTEMGTRMGLTIKCQKEEIFDVMHRI